MCLFFINMTRRRQWHPTPVLLLGKSHGWRSLVGCSPWGREESDTTERLHFDFSLSCIGEGNGNPLQYSRLEDPRTGEPGGLPSMGLHRVGYDWSDLGAWQLAQVWKTVTLAYSTKRESRIPGMSPKFLVRETGRMDEKYCKNLGVGMEGT